MNKAKATTSREFIERGEESRFEIQRSLGRIEGQLLSIDNSFKQHLIDDASSFKEVKINIATMQAKLWTFGGIFLSIGFLLTHSDKLLTFLR